MSLRACSSQPFHAALPVEEKRGSAGTTSGLMGPGHVLTTYQGPAGKMFPGRKAVMAFQHGGGQDQGEGERA